MVHRVQEHRPNCPRSLSCATTIANLGQLGSKEDQIRLQNSTFAFYWRVVWTSLHRRLCSCSSLLRLMFNLFKKTSKVESFENSLSRLPRLTPLSRIVNYCRSILIRRSLFECLLLSRVTGMLVIKLSVRRERNVGKRRGLMRRGNDNLLR